jgi:hypothetical protein
LQDDHEIATLMSFTACTKELLLALLVDSVPRFTQGSFASTINDNGSEVVIKQGSFANLILVGQALSIESELSLRLDAIVGIPRVVVGVCTMGEDEYITRSLHRGKDLNKVQDDANYALCSDGHLLASKVGWAEKHHPPFAMGEERLCSAISHTHRRPSADFKLQYTPAVGGGQLDWWVNDKPQKRVIGIDTADDGVCFFVGKFGGGECKFSIT